MQSKSFEIFCNRLKSYIEGTPCAVKVACTVWSGGKFRDNIKELPITIKESYAKYTGEGIGVKLLVFSGKSSDRFIYVGKYFTVFDLGNCCMAVCGERFFTESDIVKIDSIN